MTRKAKRGEKPRAELKKPKPVKLVDWQKAERLAKFEPQPYDGPRCDYCGGEAPGGACSNSGPDYPHPPEEPTT